MSGVVELKPARNATEHAESLLVSCVVSSWDRFPEAIAVRPEDFSTAQGRDVWRALLACFAEGVRPDLIELEKRTHLPFATVAQLASADTLGFQVARYARDVREAAQHRELSEKLGSTLKSGARGEALVSALSAVLEANRGPERGAALVPIGEVLRAAWDEIEQAHASGKGVSGVATGIGSLDEKALGIPHGGCTLVCGRTSEGKSALMLSIALNVAARGDEVHYYALEDSIVSTTKRAIASEARVSLSSLIGGSMSASDWQSAIGAAKDLHALPLRYYTHGFDSASQLIASARAMIALRAPKLVVIDYVQMLREPDQRFGGSRAAELSFISQRLQLLAKNTGVPILLGCQVNRAGVDEPELHHLKDCGALEEHAIAVWMIWNAQKLSEAAESDVRRLRIVKIAKNKNGPRCSTVLRFDAPSTRFMAADSDDARVVAERMGWL